MLKLNGSKNPIVRGKKVYQRVNLDTIKSKTVIKIDNLLTSIQSNDINQILKSNMISKVRNGYKIKVGYGNKNEVINDELIGYYDNQEGFAPVVEDLNTIKNAIISGNLDTAFDRLLNSYRERAEKGKGARRVTLVA